MVMYSWTSDQLWEFLEGQNCMKKFLTAGKIQQKSSGIHSGKQFSLFSSVFERGIKKSFQRFKLWICFYPTKQFIEA